MRFLQSLALAAVASAAVMSRQDRDAAKSLQARSPDPKLPFDPNTTPYCTWWYENEDNSLTCEGIPLYWYITEAQWKRWNPTIAESCDNYVTGRSYCVEANDEPAQPDPTTSKGPVTAGPTSTTTKAGTTTTKVPPTTTTTKPGNGIETPQPTQPGMVDNCDSFYKVKQGDGCDAIASSHGISPTQFYTWNPEVGNTCAGLYADVYVCISIIGQEPTPTTTKPDNGITTPTPIQPGMVDNCDSFYKVKTGEGCDDIASAHGITSAQFYTWNPKVGNTCAGLFADVYVCISIVGHTPTPTTTKPDNGITTPTPIQPGMVDNCDSFYKVKTGEGCDAIASSHGITSAQFYKWNPKVGTTCAGLFADVYVCISIIGVDPTPTDPGNGIATPTPVRDNMTKSCNKFHFVESGQTCDVITKKYGITLALFTKWNPDSGSDCRGLFASTYVCVSVIGYTPTPTQPSNGITTPTPTQAGMTKNCKKFHFVTSGQTCDVITKKYGISTSQLISWNPAAGTDCRGLFANTYCCVEVL